MMAKEPTPDGSRSSKASGPRISTALLIVIAAVWFIIVNHGRVGIWLWIPRITAPMWLVLLLTFAAGMLTGLLLRRRRRNR
jgi:uncharacterized integral membrane protein